MAARCNLLLEFGIQTANRSHVHAVMRQLNVGHCRGRGFAPIQRHVQA